MNIRKSTRAKVRAATTIQRFYTHKLASDATKFGLTRKTIISMPVTEAIQTVKDKRVVHTMKLLLVRFLALVEDKSATNDAGGRVMMAMNSRVFAWAYLSAYNEPFIQYQLRIGDTLSQHAHTTAVEMLDVFESLRVSILSLPRGADPTEFVEKAQSLERLLSLYTQAFFDWDIYDKQRILGICTERMMKLFELEDGLVTADVVSRRALQSLDDRKKAVRTRMMNVSGGVGGPVLAQLEKNRLEYQLAKVGHELLFDPNLDIDTHRYKFASTQQHKLPNLVLLVDKQGVKFEREYMAKIFTNGSCNPENTYKWLFAIMHNGYGYNVKCDETQMKKRKEYLFRLANGLSTSQVKAFTAASFVSLLTGDNRPTMAKCPDTLVFDLHRIAMLHKNFHLQWLCIALVEVVATMLCSTKLKSFERFSMLETIVDEVISKEMDQHEHIEEIVTIVQEVLQPRYTEFSKKRETIRKVLVEGLKEKGDEIDGIKQILRKVMYAGVLYNDEFATVTDARKCFKKFNLPIEAIGLYTLLHRQGLIVHKLVEINTDIHMKRYSSIMADACISILYQYP